MSNVSVDDFCSKKPSSATWALCWKQWRELLSPMAMLTLGSLVLLTTFGFLVFEEGDFEEDEYYGVMITVPIMMSICFTFVCCFISFVSESESQTSSFLQNLPLSSVHVGVVKVCVILATVAAFCLGQALMAGVGAWIKLRRDWFWEARLEELVNELTGSGQTILFFVVIVALVIAISLVSCSFWSRSWMSVLTAALLTCYSVFAIASLADTNDYLTSPFSWWLAASLAVVVLEAIWFPLRWLRRRPSSFARRTSDAVCEMKSSFVGTDVATSPAGKKARTLFGIPRGGRFGALLWQSFGQQRIVLMFCSFFFLVFSICGLGALVNHGESFFEGVLPALLPAFSLTGLCAGWLTLHHDKKNNNLEFFQQHREHGIALLVARIIPPLAVLSVLTCVALVYKSEMAWRFNHSNAPRYFEPLGSVLIFSGLTGYCASLLCSMVFRSQVYALGVALMVGIVGTWTTAMLIGANALDHPDHVIVSSLSWMLALPFVWLISSVAYGPRWLSQRRSWPWTAYLTVILLCAFALPIYLWACWVLGVEFET